MEQTAVKADDGTSAASSKSVEWMKGSVRYHWDSEHRWLGVRRVVFSRFSSPEDVVSPRSKIDRKKEWIYLEDLTDGRDFLRRAVGDAASMPGVIRRIPEVCDGPVSPIRSMPSVTEASSVHSGHSGVPPEHAAVHPEQSAVLSGQGSAS